MERHADAPRVQPATGSILFSPSRRTGFDYSCFKVFSCPLEPTDEDGSEALPPGYRFAELTPADLEAAQFPELRDCQEYGGSGSHTFGIFRADGALVCVHCVWSCERYMQRGFWPIEPDAVVSMRLVAAAEQRKELATHLQRYSTRRLREQGFSRLYSRIPWPRRAPLRKPGWSRAGTILEFSLSYDEIAYARPPVEKPAIALNVGAPGDKRSEGVSEGRLEVTRSEHRIEASKGAVWLAGQVKRLAKKIARFVLGDYAMYCVYACTRGQVERFASFGPRLGFAAVDEAQVQASHDPFIADHAGYHGSESNAYASTLGAEIVGLCYFWHGARYRTRNFWPLADDEAKLVQVGVTPKARRQAIATNLIAWASEDMFQKGFRCLYARIWHSNTPSRRAFERAGWIHVATVAQAHPMPRLGPLRVVIRHVPRMTAVDPSLTAHSIVRRSTTLDLQERLQARSAASAPRVHTSIGRTLLAPLRRAGFDYSCFRVFTYALQPTDADAGEPLPAGYRAAELAAADLQAAQFPELRDCAEYGGSGSHTFGIFRADGALVCVQCVWFGERYRQRRFWPVEADAAVSMHLVTAAAEQGKGLATHLKRYSASRLRAKGFSRLYSRIWWTNRPSLRVSEKAGWSRVGTILEVSLPWSRRPVRVVFSRR